MLQQQQQQQQRQRQHAEAMLGCCRGCAQHEQLPLQHHGDSANQFSVLVVSGPIPLAGPGRGRARGANSANPRCHVKARFDPVGHTLAIRRTSANPPYVCNSPFAVRHLSTIPPYVCNSPYVCTSTVRLQFAVRLQFRRTVAIRRISALYVCHSP